MAESKAITDYPCDEILEPRTVLIANITPELEFNTPVQFFEDLKRTFRLQETQDNCKNRQHPN